MRGLQEGEARGAQHTEAWQRLPTLPQLSEQGLLTSPFRRWRHEDSSIGRGDRRRLCGHEHPIEDHDTLLLQVDDQAACIDVGIAPLVEWCWLRGLKTRYSCEGSTVDSDPADISFVSGADLETAYWALLELVRDDECLFNRASNVRAAIDAWSTRPPSAS